MKFTFTTKKVDLSDSVKEYAEKKISKHPEEFGHGIKRELGYLVVHSVLHLLGYDHLDEGPMKQQMRRREEEIMARLLLKR